jgi:hypothetical protein
VTATAKQNYAMSLSLLEPDTEVECKSSEIHIETHNAKQALLFYETRPPPSLKNQHLIVRGPVTQDDVSGLHKALSEAANANEGLRHHSTKLEETIRSKELFVKELLSKIVALECKNESLEKVNSEASHVFEKYTKLLSEKRDANEKRKGDVL